MKELKTAQELIKTTNSHVSAGFNQFIHGGPPPVMSEYGDKSQWFAEQQGYEYAKDMAMNHGVAFTHVFKCNQDGCLPFLYGGFFVCNSCGKKSVDKDWWKIQVEKDGNAYCCHGLDFINLQESSNYAFGDTFEEAIENYGLVMLKGE
ncbi:hypothetical protein [Leptospira phage LE3]|uniref:Uncharacterized protein n=1 Tax=Leptospira phage LE3 TaxID=2041382 RepID=A0A343LE76_9CAUD|nr:hypothetical protein HWB33_gp08 [Leptospira phage LE3]ATN94986.1 hypothetical protein [Leptospira phage LE3]